MREEPRNEPRDIRVRRLKLRSMRRGIKEMDLILGGFAETGLDGLSDSDLALYDEMLGENDHDMYAWASGQDEAPDKFARLMAHVLANGPRLKR